jgi:hypothetical protein
VLNEGKINEENDFSNKIDEEIRNLKVDLKNKQSDHKKKDLVNFRLKTLKIAPQNREKYINVLI